MTSVTASIIRDHDKLPTRIMSLALTLTLNLYSSDDGMVAWLHFACQGGISRPEPAM